MVQAKEGKESHLGGCGVTAVLAVEDGGGPSCAVATVRGWEVPSLAFTAGDSQAELL